MMLKMMECKLHQSMHTGDAAERARPPPAAGESAKRGGHGSGMGAGRGWAGFSQQWTLDSMGNALQRNHADVLELLKVRCAAGCCLPAPARLAHLSLP